MILALLAACSPGPHWEPGDFEPPNGTGVGNPDLIAVRLVPPDGGYNGASADLRATLTDCSGNSGTARFRNFDLLHDQETLPEGAFCSLELDLRDLTTDPDLGIDAAVVVFPLDGLPSVGQGWVVELGNPDDPTDLVNGSGLYLDTDGDHELGALERAVGPVSAGSTRPEHVAEPVWMVSGWDGLRATFALDGAALASDASGSSWSDIVVYGGEVLTVGGAAGGVIGSSTDAGLSWTDTAVAAPLSSAAVAGDSVYAASFEGPIYESTDGTSWTEVHTSTVGWQRIASGDGLLVAVGEDRVASGAGGSWTDQSLASGLLLDVAWGDPGWVAVGEDGRRWYSTDGTAWSATGGTGDKLASVVWTGAAYVAVGDGTGSTSTDGQTWTDLPERTLDRLVVTDGGLLGLDGGTVLASGDGGQSWSTAAELDGAATQGLSGLVQITP